MKIFHLKPCNRYGGLMYVVTARFLVATPDMTQVVRPLRATPATPDRINPPVSTPADENHNWERSTMKLRPLHDRVVIRRSEEESKTAGGIVLPGSAAEKPTAAKSSLSAPVASWTTAKFARWP
jgi:hypothetical protein